MLTRKPVIGDVIYYNNPKTKKREYFGKVARFRGYGNEIAVTDTVYKNRIHKYKGREYVIPEYNEFVHTFHVNGKERLNLRMEIANEPS